MGMCLQDKKKMANVIYKQSFKEAPVDDLEYSPRMGIEACAKDMMSAFQAGDEKMLADVLESFLEISKGQEDYKKENSVTVGA